jgi:Protein of unknown function (DUF4085)
MNYFTPALLERFGSLDPAIAAAGEAEFETAHQRYEEHLRRIEPDLSQHVKEFNDLLLHDARVLSIARPGDELVMVLRQDVPPRDLVLLTYSLIGEPVIDREALPENHRSEVMDFLYDELDVVHEDGRVTFAQSILFGNGWEMRLRFSDVRVALAASIYPLPEATLVGSPPVARSA